MAIDTRNKRQSVQGYTLTPVLPVADSAIDQYDREMVAWLYAGIAAGAIVSSPAAGFARLFDYPSHEVVAIDRPTHNLSVKDYAGHEVIVYDKDGK